MARLSRAVRSLSWGRFAGALGLVVVFAALNADSGAEEVCECWSDTTCEDGIVTLYLPSCVCGEPTEVIENAYECERGCRTDGGSAFDLPPRFACEEWRNKNVGDPCTTRRDCLPATFGTYLACDPETQACAQTDPPAVPDYLTQCGVTNHDVKFPFYPLAGFVPSDACDGNLCVIATEQDCIRQGCTIPCEFPQDCPRGATCEERRDSRAFKLRFEVRKVCVPDTGVNVGIDCPEQ